MEYEYDVFFKLLIEAIVKRIKLAALDHWKRVFLFADTFGDLRFHALIEVSHEKIQTADPTQDWNNLSVTYLTSSFRGFLMRWCIQRRNIMQW